MAAPALSAGRPFFFIVVADYCADLSLYSIDSKKALTITALMKLPLNWCSDLH
jgi:hypothetical protein